MSALLMQNGGRLDVESWALTPDGRYSVKLVGGGSLMIPRAQVARVDFGSAASRPVMATGSRGPWRETPDPNLGRPTSQSPEFGLPPSPLALPPNDLDLGYRSDEYDFMRAAKDAVARGQQDQFARVGEAYNAQRPNAAIDYDAMLNP